jgi:hypothetical protein
MTTKVILANTHHGWNHHIWDLHLTDLATTRKVALSAQVLYLHSTYLVKSSILLSFLTRSATDVLPQSVPGRYL